MLTHFVENGNCLLHCAVLWQRMFLVWWTWGRCIMGLNM